MIRNQNKTYAADWKYKQADGEKNVYEEVEAPDFEKVDQESESLMREIISHMQEGPSSLSIQKLIAKHYRSLSVFHEPTLTVYRGLANLYVEDRKFSDNFKKYGKPDLSRFMRDAMVAYCDLQEKAAA